MKFKLIFLLSFVLSSHLALADSSAGCGLGTKLVTRKSLLGTSVASSIEATFSGIPRISGMTSGTSGCSRHDLVKADEEAVLFAQRNMDHLQMEVAQGQGEFLVGLAKGFGCEDQVLTQFGLKAQENYGKLFPLQQTHQDPNTFVSTVKDLVQTTPQLAKGCHLVI